MIHQFSLKGFFLLQFHPTLLFFCLAGLDHRNRLCTQRWLSRWHSCPSDSGSYVCGNLGYNDEC
jgi:hypothetical protein